MRRNRQQSGMASSSKRNNAGDQTRQSFQLRQAITGSMFTPSEMPPTFCGQPYANITLIIRVKDSSVTVNVTLIKKTLTYQAGFADKDVDFDFRLQSIAVWGIGSTNLVVFPKDFIHSKDGSVEITRLDSNAMKNMYPRIGFKYPFSHQSLNISTVRDAGGSRETQLCEIKADMGSLEIHAKIHWRGADSRQAVLLYDYPAPKTPEGRIAELQKQLNELKFALIDNEVSDFEEPSIE